MTLNNNPNVPASHHLCNTGRRRNRRWEPWGTAWLTILVPGPSLGRGTLPVLRYPWTGPCTRRSCRWWWLLWRGGWQSSSTPSSRCSVYVPTSSRCPPSDGQILKRTKVYFKNMTTLFFIVLFCRSVRLILFLVKLMENIRNLSSPCHSRFFDPFWQDRVHHPGDLAYPRPPHTHLDLLQLFQEHLPSSLGRSLT